MGGASILNHRILYSGGVIWIRGIIWTMMCHLIQSAVFVTWVRLCHLCVCDMMINKQHYRGPIQGYLKIILLAWCPAQRRKFTRSNIKEAYLRYKQAADVVQSRYVKFDAFGPAVSRLEISWNLPVLPFYSSWHLFLFFSGIDIVSFDFLRPWICSGIG